MPEFKHTDTTERIIGLFYDVYNGLGFGFLESVYHQAMAIALRDAGLHAESKARLPVFFRGQPVGDFEADIIVERCIILEFKAADDLCSAHEAQLLNYLKASAVEVGLLLNFGCSVETLARLRPLREGEAPAEPRVGGSLGQLGSAGASPSRRDPLPAEDFNRPTFGPKPRIKRLAFSNERKRSRPEVVVDFLLTFLIVSFSAFIVRLL